MHILEKLSIERNSNYAPGDVRANYFLMWDGADCIGGIDTQSGTGLIATIHIPPVDSDDPDADCTVIGQRPYYSEDDLEALKTDLLEYATMAINAGELHPRSAADIKKSYTAALIASLSR